MITTAAFAQRSLPARAAPQTVTRRNKPKLNALRMNDRAQSMPESSAVQRASFLPTPLLKNGRYTLLITVGQ